MDKKNYDDKPGPSGYQKNTQEVGGASTNKETQKKQESKYKDKIVKPKKKKVEKEKKVAIKEGSRENSYQSHHRRSSSEQTMSRYMLPIRPTGHQRSNSVRDFLKTVEKPKIDKQEIPKTVSTEETVDRDHHDAIDLYFRSTGFHKESLSHLRKSHKKESKTWHLHRRKGSKVVCNLDSKHNHHIKRCKNCLEPQDKCVCDNIPHQRPQSDWMTLILPKSDEKVYVENRLDWLEKLEKNSKFDLDEIIENKFDPSYDICCFPFNTFRIFSRRDIDIIDYYEKADKNKTPDLL